MFYFFAFVFICWGLTIYFLTASGGEKRGNKLRTAMAQMKAATDMEEKRTAARQVLEVIESNEMSGIVAEDARKAAEQVLA